MKKVDVKNQTDDNEIPEVIYKGMEFLTLAKEFQNHKLYNCGIYDCPICEAIKLMREGDNREGEE